MASAGHKLLQLTEPCGCKGECFGKSVKHNLMEVTFYFTNLCITFFNDFSLKVKFRHMKEELDLESFINSIYNTKGFKSILCVSDQNKSFAPHFFIFLLHFVSQKIFLQIYSINMKISQIYQNNSSNHVYVFVLMQTLIFFFARQTFLIMMVQSSPTILVHIQHMIILHITQNQCYRKKLERESYMLLIVL